ncbi:YcxB family protein [Nocardia sp. NPDC051570]|uniref:YcxB family protein n=1 Tax=Nocardia sp. NPDC051570 TaxID=3364324 RepID=UPI0037B7FE20
MQISMWVPYDKKRRRRGVKFVLRSQLNSLYIGGVGLVVLGLVFLAQGFSELMGYFLLGLGVFWVVAMPPITVAQTIRKQSGLAKDGVHVTLDDEGVTTIHPLVESRIRWAALSHTVETSEVWYLVLSKLSALSIPKALMTADQQTEFAAFLAEHRTGRS